MLCVCLVCVYVCVVCVCGVCVCVCGVCVCVCVCMYECVVYNNNNNNNNNIYLLQLGCHPVAVFILHVNKT